MGIRIEGIARTAQRRAAIHGELCIFPAGQRGRTAEAESAQQAAGGFAHRDARVAGGLIGERESIVEPIIAGRDACGGSIDPRKDGRDALGVHIVRNGDAVDGKGTAAAAVHGGDCGAQVRIGDGL